MDWTYEKRCLTGILDIEMIKKIMFCQAAFFLLIFLARGCDFSSQLPTPRFLSKMSIFRVSDQLCRFKLNRSAFQFEPLCKRGFFVFTLGASHYPYPSVGWLLLGETSQVHHTLSSISLSVGWLLLGETS